MSKLKEKLMLSEKGYSDLKKAITACTITNIALLLPSMVACLLFWELLKPFTGEAISWAALWKLLGLGLVAAILVYIKNNKDYSDRYEQKIVIYGKNGTPANVVVGWIHRPDGSISMSSAYIKEVK